MCIRDRCLPRCRMTIDLLLSRVFPYLYFVLTYLCLITHRYTHRCINSCVHSSCKYKHHHSTRVVFKIYYSVDQGGIECQDEIIFLCVSYDKKWYCYILPSSLTRFNSCNSQRVIDFITSVLHLWGRTVELAIN